MLELHVEKLWHTPLGESVVAGYWHQLQFREYVPHDVQVSCWLHCAATSSDADSMQAARMAKPRIALAADGLRELKAKSARRGYC